MEEQANLDYHPNIERKEQRLLAFVGTRILTVREKEEG
jgi:hypothetical protein